MQSPPIDAVVAIASPQGDRAVLGADLAWRTGEEVAFIAGVRWAGRAQELLHDAALDTLTQQRGVRAIVQPGQARADYEVRWTIRSFEVVSGGAGGTARFSADVLIINARDSNVIASRTISAEAPVSSRSASQAAQGLTRAAREGDARLGVFVVETLAAQARTASSSR
jgi:ABC-type uncharacterized transport system auxiliary subunit